LNKEIEQLTELQVIDLGIAKLDAEKDTKLAGLQEREKAFEEREASIAALQEKIEAAEARRRDLEAELADELGRIKERQSKMMQVQTNREYQSLLKEIEDGKKNNKEREDEIVQLMEVADADTKIMNEQADNTEEEKKSLESETKEAQKFADDIEKKKTGIVKKRKTKAKKINSSVLRKYDMLRERRNGKAIVAVTKGVCQGCFMSIPPQHFNNILKGDKMLNCPTCQRILYHQPESDEE
jgi:predicted  nucleic acid-binding Zn-ribbon protein